MRSRVVLALTVALLVAPATAVQAAAPRPVAVWEMNEPAGARSMRDSGGGGLHGRIGADVVTGARIAGAFGYSFPRLEPDRPPARPRHLVVVPHSTALNPGNRDFAVTVRTNTRIMFGNIIQKGQSGNRGGYFKVENPGGVIQCFFQGPEGRVAVRSPRRLNDGRWHTIRCKRTARGVSMLVDGELVARGRGRTGTIANDWPVAIAGKVDCDQIEVGCDYYAGHLDRIRIDAG